MVVNNGEIIEQGTHEDLIAAEGKYAELWSKQVRPIRANMWGNKQYSWLTVTV